MSDFSCCNMTFATREKLYYHNKRVHQMQTEVNINGRKGKKIILYFNILRSVIVIIERVNGKFHCICGNYENENPANIRNHVSNCQKINIVDALDIDENENEEENMEVNEEIEENSSEVENSEIVENEFLKNYNLRINEKYHLLICRTCKYVVEKENAFNHVSKNHRKIVDSKLLKPGRKEELLDQLNIVDPLLNRNLNFESEEIIEGLNIYEGFKCGNGECNYLCRHMNTLYDHSRKEHVNSKMIYEECFIQTLFLNPEKRKYFKVKKNSRSTSQVEEGENNEIFGVSRTLNTSRVGHQFVSSFETESNWSVIIDKLGAEGLKGIFGLTVPLGLEQSINMVFNRGEEFSRVSNHYFSELIENPFSK